MHFLRNTRCFQGWLIILIFSCPASLFAQEKMMLKIAWGSRSYVMAEVLAVMQGGCMNKMVAFLDAKTNTYQLSLSRDSGYLFHGSYTLINSFGDKQRIGQYSYGMETGRFVDYDPYNKKLCSITDFGDQGMQKQKLYVFDESHVALLSVIIDSALAAPQTYHVMDRVWRKVYDSTETVLLREEISLNNVIRKVRIYYPNGNVKQEYRIRNNDLFEFSTKLGDFEEFYENGKRKTIGHYSYNTPVGVWLYFDSKGKKSAKNHTKMEVR